MPPRPPIPWAQAFSPLSRSQCPFRSRIQQQIRTIRSINRQHPKFDRFNPYKLATGKPAVYDRKKPYLPNRPGALAIKKGMTAIYDANTGIRTPCTVLQLERVEVVSSKNKKKNGYCAVQIGAGWQHPDNVTRPELGRFAGLGVSPKRYLTEFRVKVEGGLLPSGTKIGAEWFRVGQFVDARADSKGKGFAGGMKKFGWHGQPASHGVSKTHRQMGSAGGSQGSGSRVIPGKKMPGRMGGEQVCVQNLKVMMVDEPNGLVVVKGAVSGPKGCIVKLQDALKKPKPAMILPTADMTSAAQMAATA